jgi:uncharacterized membrane protein (DUF106 family)
MLNRILIFGWPLVAICVLVPLLNELHAPPALAVAVYAIVGLVAALIQVAFLDIQKWLTTEEERAHDERSTSQTGISRPR